MEKTDDITDRYSGICVSRRGAVVMQLGTGSSAHALIAGLYEELGVLRGTAQIRGARVRFM